jgi:hypothetical protein
MVIRLLTTRGLARRAGCSPNFLLGLVRSGGLEAFAEADSGAVLFRADDLPRLLTEINGQRRITRNANASASK